MVGVAPKYRGNEFGPQFPEFTVRDPTYVFHCRMALKFALEFTKDTMSFLPGVVRLSAAIRTEAGYCLFNSEEGHASADRPVNSP